MIRNYVSAIAIAIAVLVSATAASAVPPAPPSPTPVMYATQGQTGFTRPVRHPHELIIGAGGNLSVNKITWSAWRQKSAAGHGTLASCGPSGCFHFSVKLTASGVLTHNGRRFFSKIAAAHRKCTASGSCATLTYHFRFQRSGPKHLYRWVPLDRQTT